MFYKLLTISICIFNITNYINANNYNCCNEALNNCNYINNNSSSNLDSIVSIKKENLSNQNSSSLNSIASTNSNTSDTMIYSTDSQEQVDLSNENSVNSYKILTNNCNGSNQINSLSNITLVNSIDTSKFDEANKCFQNYCGIQNLDIIRGKKHLLSLYTYFNKLNNTSSTKQFNKANNSSYTSISDYFQINSNKYNDHLAIDKFNNRFCILLNIAYGFLKTSKECNYNKNITDDYIKNIGTLTYNAYYENGLFTRDVIMTKFNSYKDSLIQAINPLLITLES